MCVHTCTHEALSIYSRNLTGIFKLILMFKLKTIFSKSNVKRRMLKSVMKKDEIRLNFCEERKIQP